MKKFGIVFCLLICFSSCCVFSACGVEDFISNVEKNGHNYDIKIQLDVLSKEIIGEENVEFVNGAEESLNYVCFHLYPKAFSKGATNKPVSALNFEKAYPNGVDYGIFNVESVEEEGKKVRFEFLNTDKDILKVFLKGKVKPSCRTNLKIKWKAKLPNINHRYGYGNNTISLGNFYPIVSVFENGEFDLDGYNYNGDPFYSELSNYSVSLKLLNDEGNYVVAGSGVCENEGNGLWNFKAKAVRSFALVLSNKYEKKEKEIDGVKVAYFYYEDENANESFNACLDSLNTFEELFGEYPYETLNVCKSNFVHGGMEFSNLVMISDDIPLYEDYVHTIAHEIAHQWWYGVVGNDEFEYGFLDESLTEYSSLMFYEKNPKYNRNVETMIKNSNNSYAVFVEIYSDVFEDLDTSMNRRLDEFNTEPEYVYMSYVKGVLMYDNVRKIVGDKKFIKSLRHYYSKNAGKNVVPNDLIASFQKYCGKDIKSIFDSYILGKVVIEKVALN